MLTRDASRNSMSLRDKLLSETRQEREAREPSAAAAVELRSAADSSVAKPG